MNVLMTVVLAKKNFSLGVSRGPKFATDVIQKWHWFFKESISSYLQSFKKDSQDLVGFFRGWSLHATTFDIVSVKLSFPVPVCCSSGTD